MTAQEEVDAMKVTKSRPLKRMVLSRTYGSSQTAQPKFLMSGEEPVSLKAFKDPKFSLLKKLVDGHAQVSSPLEATATQTLWERSINSSSQYQSADFLKMESLSERVAQSLAEFLRKPETSLAMEVALQSNETIDVYTNALASSDQLEDDTDTTFFRELRSFHDVTYTKGQLVQHMEWVSNSSRSQLSCSYVSTSSFNDRLSSSSLPSVSHILFWNYYDSLAPKLVLTSPWDVHIFRFWPVKDPSYVIGGLSSGQLAIWKFKTPSEGTSISPLAISSLESSHKQAARSLEFLDSSVVLDKTGAVIDAEKLAMIDDDEVVSDRFVMTTSSDGSISFWDIADAVESQRDFEPFYTMTTLIRIDAQRDLGCVRALPAPEIGKTSFIASTDEGEYLVGDWAAQLTAQEDRRPEYIQLLSSSVTRTLRPTVAFERSPFFPQILLGVTDWSAVIWKVGIESPLLVTAAPPAYYTCGAWSPHRSSVFFLGRADGQLEVWDLQEQSNKPSSATAASAVALSSLRFMSGQVGDLHDLLAVGDEQGHLKMIQVPLILKTSTAKELEFVRGFFEKEEARLNYLSGRSKELADARTAAVIAAQKAAVDEEMGTGKSAPVASENLEISNIEKEFEILRKTFSNNLK